MKHLRIPSVFVFMALAFVLSSCSKDSLPQYSIIQGLRVLALTLDQPEVNYNSGTFTPATVNLSPWISDLYGAGRALSINVYACLDPGIGLGAKPDCTTSQLSVLTYQSIVQNQTVAGSATFLAPNYTGALAAIPLALGTLGSTLNSLISTGSISLTTAQDYNGYSILIFFELYPSSDPSNKITSFKRLVFSGNSKTTKNQNPSGLEIQLSGTEIASLPTVASDLKAYAPAASAETYQSLDTAGSFTSKTESLLTTWFLTGPSDISCSKNVDCTTDGKLSLTFSNLGQINSFTPPKTATSTRGRILIGVLKDDRGGEQVKRYCDGICP